MGKQKTTDQPHSFPGNQKVGLNIAPSSPFLQQLPMLHDKAERHNDCIHLNIQSITFHLILFQTYLYFVPLRVATGYVVEFGIAGQRKESKYSSNTLSPERPGLKRKVQSQRPLV